VCCKGQGIPGAGGQSGTLGIIRRLFLRIWGGQEPPPPPEEKIFCPRGQAETQPMLPARSYYKGTTLFPRPCAEKVARLRRAAKSPEIPPNPPLAKGGRGGFIGRHFLLTNMFVLMRR